VTAVGLALAGKEAEYSKVMVKGGVERVETSV